MRNYIVTLALLLFSGFALAQEIKTDLPTILPPSPTVAALMKFEEVPVNNYTGIPDVSIPLYSCPTHSKDIGMNISLKYHPAITASDRASDVGLGWSLFAGGSISRTVKGMPDEIFEMGSNARIGIYHDSITDYKNKYYEIFEELKDEYTSAFDAIDEYLWDAQVRGRLDTEHDLWQFNFMGHSGRFYIRKDSLGQLVVTPLDEYRLKIVNIYGDSFNSYRPTGFEIYDDKGYKYVFDIVETTDTWTYTNSGSLYYDVPTYSENATSTLSYDSAFHLSEVMDNQGNPIITITYRSEEIKEMVLDKTNTIYVEDYTTNAHSIRDFLILVVPCPELVFNFNPLPSYTNSTNQRNTFVKKIEQVQIPGIARINFKYSKGREDTNFHAPDSSYVFKGLDIRKWSLSDTVSIRRIRLEQGYTTVTEDRMVLEKVSFTNTNETLSEDYTFAYRQNTNPLDLLVTTDYWGYFTLVPTHYTGIGYKEPHRDFGTSDVLQKMSYPSGGCAIFDFEANTYSYDGSTELTDYDSNPYNWEYHDAPFTFTEVADGEEFLFTIADEQEVVFETENSFDDKDWRIRLYKYNTGTSSYDPVTYFEGLVCEGEADCLFRYTLLPGSYYVELFTVALDFPAVFTSKITAFYKTKTVTTKNYFYGGGNRIARIGYFDTDVPANFYQNNVGTPYPNKEKSYNYSLASNASKSSGSLAYSVPKFDYYKFKKECSYCEVAEAVTWKDDQAGFYYDVYTTFNNLNPIKTQGGDVGYKNVSVSEIDNGRIDYEYSSPISDPETLTAENLASPFLPTKNIDYKRGLLKKEKVYDKDSRILKETTMAYTIQDTIAETGIRIFYNQSDFINIYGHTYFSQYKDYIESCSQNPHYITNDPCNNQHLTDQDDCECFCYYGPVSDFIDYRFIEEAYGWAKLTSKITKDYFYPSGPTPNIVETEETYEYNPVNMKISESILINGLDEEMKTEYYYHTGNSIHSDNRISEIEMIKTYRDAELLSTSKIIYDDDWPDNESYLPQSIVTAKGADSLEDRIIYNLYDEYSNPLELQQEGGTVVSYIWGHNKTMPIAKIENATNAQIATALSLGDLSTVDETDISAIDALRSTMSGAMITTYTYIPLVGVETITDPKGDKLTYEYDSFQRLKAVYDKDGYKLSENTYNYRTQN